MKCQILVLGKNKKNIINLSSAENAQRVVKVKHTVLLDAYQVTHQLWGFHQEQLLWVVY